MATENEEQIEASATNPLEELLIIGRVRKNVKIFDFDVTMQVLNSGEQRQVYELTSTQDALARMAAIQHETLARAIKALNGKPVTYTVGDKEEKVSRSKIIEQNLKLLKKASKPVIDLLFNEYSKLVDDQNEKIDELKKKSGNHGPDGDG